MKQATKDLLKALLVATVAFNAGIFLLTLLIKWGYYLVLWTWNLF